MTKLFIADLADIRFKFASKYLNKMGYIMADNPDSADYIIPPAVKKYDNKSNTVLVPYNKDSAYLLQNAYITAECAICVALQNSVYSLINANILIVGYGRIGTALNKYLAPFTSNITVCARAGEQLALAKCNGSKTITFDKLYDNSKFDFIFNTVPHPVFNERELKNVNTHCTLIDLASFPGGVDNHISKAYGVNLVIARGLPAKYSPASSGKLIATTVNRLIKEGIV